MIRPHPDSLIHGSTAFIIAAAPTRVLGGPRFTRLRMYWVAFLLAVIATAVGGWTTMGTREVILLALSGIFGLALGELSKARQETSAPDTRSWLSLPSTIQATRLRMRKGVDQIQVVSLDANGKRLARTTLDINPDSHGVAYVRSMGRIMYPQVADQLWMASR